MSVLPVTAGNDVEYGQETYGKEELNDEDSTRYRDLWA